ncbi:MAG: F0F1 ATP synthase subunit B, partial [Solirubrobacterales bacterium]
IQEALDRRAKLIAESIEAAERSKKESEELTAEYRARLKEAREQADDIVARARKAADTTKSEAAEEGKEKREELLAAARRDIEAETRRSLERIRKEVADLTVLTTEKVARKSLDSADHKRLVDEALAEVDFATLSPEGSKG